jgi:hypothetical protein
MYARPVSMPEETAAALALRALHAFRTLASRRHGRSSSSRVLIILILILIVVVVVLLLLRAPPPHGTPRLDLLLDGAPLAQRFFHDY